jgi:hypothetical protein
VSYRQKEINAIKAMEDQTPVSEQVKQAREKARKLLCQTCDDGLCSSKCIR